MSRIYGEYVTIDSLKVKNFFENRFCAENPLASVMLRANPSDNIAEIRNSNETLLLKGFLQNRDNLHILDLGCGTGRWAINIEEKISSYTGIDFCKNYIVLAKVFFKRKKNYSFYEGSILNPSEEILSKNYNLIIINGTCMYMNDDDILTVFKYIKKISSTETVIFFRESISTIGKRMSLKDYYSEELNTEYNAIYRTPEEYENKFFTLLQGKSIRMTGYLLNEETGVRPETNQKYWIIQ